MSVASAVAYNATWAPLKEFARFASSRWSAQRTTHIIWPFLACFVLLGIFDILVAMHRIVGIAGVELLHKLSKGRLELLGLVDKHQRLDPTVIRQLKSDGFEHHQLGITYGAYQKN